MKVSIIIPCLNEEKTIPLFIKEIGRIDFKREVQLELLFIDDGSTDTSLKILREEHTHQPNLVKYISFSRNFGKEAAIYAGMKNATGDYVGVMDVDLQDPPNLLPTMLQLLIDEDYDCIGTIRSNRKGEPKIRSLFSKIFYKLINAIGETEIIDGVRDFRLMKRDMVNAVLEITEYNRFSKGIFSWVGFKTKYISYPNIERVAGETSWSFWKLFKYSLDGIVNFSDAPLNIASFVGAFSCIAAIVAMVFIIIRALIFGDPTAGWPSLVTIFLFIGGIQLLCLGIIGKYIGKIFLETKKRPHFIIRETDNQKK